jgi:hypothetical protein
MTISIWAANERKNRLGLLNRAAIMLCVYIYTYIHIYIYIHTAVLFLHPRCRIAFYTHRSNHQRTGLTQPARSLTNPTFPSSRPLHTPTATPREHERRGAQSAARRERETSPAARPPCAGSLPPAAAPSPDPTFIHRERAERSERRVRGLSGNPVAHGM